MAKQVIGFVGLGTMGARMVRNLLRAGYEVLIYDVNKAAVDALEGEGARAEASPAAIARRVDTLLLSVPDSPQVIEVATGPGGISEGAHPGLVVIDHSTVAPATPQRLSKELAPLGITWLDAPVSGGPVGAANASLTIMVGGDKEAFERSRPILQVIGKNLEYMGGSGMGAIVKIVNNMAAGIQIIAMAEAFTLGAKAGIDARRLFEVLRTSSAGCWVMERLVKDVLLENRLEEKPAPLFALKLEHKDLRLAVATASALNVPLAAGSLAEQMFAIAEGRGWGDLDHMAVIRLYSDYAGIKHW